MKKALLLFLAALGLGSAQAQCTPDPLYADSVFGVWPDTVENFKAAFLDQFYSDTLNLIAPVDAELIDPDLPPVNIDSVEFLSLNGLPPGLSVVCNSHTAAPCTYLPEQLGCGLIEGTPTATGIFPLSLTVAGWFTIDLGFPFVSSQEITFTGYQIVVNEVNTGIAANVDIGLANVRNVPNPFASRTTIEWQLGRAGDARIRVFNMVGEELWTQRVQGKVGANKVVFEGGELPAGVYLYKVESGSETYTGRMALQR